MSDPAAPFEDAWERFRALHALRLVDDPATWEASRGRAQHLGFLVRIEDATARRHLAAAAERLAGIPGVEPHPDWYWHITVKAVGYQVVQRVYEDDVLRQDVPRIAGKARALLSQEEAFQAQLGLASGFIDSVFLEVWDSGRMRELNTLLAEKLSGVPRYSIDGEIFLPHISIARFTSDAGLPQLKETLAALRAEGPGPSFPVRRLELVKSWWLSEEELPELDVLATYALRSPR